MCDDSNSTLDMESLKLKMLQEAVRHSEVHLESLNNIATSADTRAGAFTGLAGVMGALFLTTASSVTYSELNFMGGIAVLIGAIGTAASCMPRGFHAPGDRFEDWKVQIDDGDTFHDILVAQGEANDKKIEYNECKLKWSADRFKAGVWIVLVSSLLVTMIQLIGAISE